MAAAKCWALGRNIDLPAENNCFSKARGKVKKLPGIRLACKIARGYFLKA
jgi:hypothetical protein